VEERVEKITNQNIDVDINTKSKQLQQ